jgi:NAD dependent epimerase/dehydratase family enzyme
VIYLAADDSSSGPFNLCCPVVPTNGEFTDALAEAVGRRARLAAPSAVLKVGAGRMAPELLGSLRTEPAALQEAGYAFQDDDVRAVIGAALQS